MLKKAVLYMVVDKRAIKYDDFKSRLDIYEDMCQGEIPRTDEFHVVFFGVKESLSNTQYLVLHELVRHKHQEKDLDYIKSYYCDQYKDFCWMCAPPGYSGKNIN